MDQQRVAAVGKKLEAKTTQELLQTCASGASGGTSPEELQAMRPILGNRQRKGKRLKLAVVSGIVFGTVAAVGAWTVLGASPLSFLAGVAAGVVAFASWYVADIVPRT